MTNKTREGMRILVAGAGGVLGRELVDILFKKQIEVVGLGYDECEFSAIEDKISRGLCCDVTRPEHLKGVCEGVDIVISTIGITRIRGKLTHMDVDYCGNLNLLREAVKAGVKKFVFISPAGVDKGYNYVPLFKAKYMFEQELKKSPIEWVIFRSGGFLRDFAEMGKAVLKGSLFVIGKGNSKSTPVDVRELARIMVEDMLKVSNRVVEVGGPQDVTWKEICNCCFAAFNRKPKIISAPVWLCKLTAVLIKPFSAKYYALARLLIFTTTVDLLTQKRGKVKLSDYLKDYYKGIGKSAKK